ncbi:MAG: NAD-dependent 4,6-dehydratase LegB [Nitrospira sp.]|jgi:NAD dependent epimerase/dehydratase|nr:NAD-dependent 4,6-dehydratase LegB [Nitrospira sp.]
MKLGGSRVLVTGADGFIGSHLTELLVQRGAEVRALSVYNSFNDWGWLEGLSCLDRLDVVNGDIRDGNFVRTITKGIDVIFHLAALISIPYSYSAPESYVHTNILGTLNVVQAGLESGVARVVHTSTSEVYGTARFIPMNETHPLQPQSPYSATKISADAIAQSFFHSFGLPVVIARPFNTYGPRQSSRAIIPTIITQILSEKKTIQLGSLHPTRDFNYVEDTCRGLLALAECDAAVGEAVNIGSGSECSVGALVDLIKAICHSDIMVSTDDIRVRPVGSEVERLVCDNAKVLSLTGFKPHYDLREGLSRTIDWFKIKSNLMRYKSRIYNV